MTVMNRSRASPIAHLLAQGDSGTLLMVSPQEEIARTIESFLRNSGHPLRCGWVNDLGEVEEMLNRDPPDVILCDITASATPPSHVIHMAAELRPDLPVLVVGHAVNPQETVVALQLGAKDLVCADDARHLRHLEMVVIREFLNHHSLRSLRLTRDRLDEFEERHRQLIKGTADAVAQVHEGILSTVNLSFARLLGREKAEDLVGTPLIDLVVSDQRTRVKERLRQVLKGKFNGEPLQFALLVGEYPLSVSAQLILSHEDGERMIEMLIRSETNNAIDQSATIVEAPMSFAGALPGMSQRAAFMQTLKGAAEANTARGAMFFVVDGFAALEDRIGLLASEEITRSITDAMRTRLLTTDAVFVFSPNEIAVHVTRPQVSDIETLGAQLKSEIAGMVHVTSQHEAQVTLSLCIYPMASSDKPELVLQDLARDARRLSQKGGNEMVVLGSAAKTNRTDREEARKGVLVKRAIENNNFKLAYQSIASLEGDARQHFDVLLRIVDEGNNELHASEFLPAAEKFGLMRAVDRWVITRALAVVVKRSAGGESPSLFLRLSEETLRDADAFVKWITELLKTQPLKNQEFVFEIQEPVLQSHVRKAVALTEALHELGAGIAINHFGITPTSTQLLEHLPRVNYLKFHHSYTQKFNDKEIQRRMSTLMEVAKAKKLKTIVSHVEDANVMARLWQMGVNFIQGYHVQEPEVVMMGSDVRG